jgi:hypothetical protein
MPQFAGFESLQIVTLFAASVLPVWTGSVGVQTTDQIPDTLRRSLGDFGVVPSAVIVIVAVWFEASERLQVATVQAPSPPYQQSEPRDTGGMH